MMIRRVLLISDNSFWVIVPYIGSQAKEWMIFWRAEKVIIYGDYST